MVYIKIREVGKKTWKFLARDGSTRLRIHAASFADETAAQRLIDENKADNPEWEWKIVK